MDVTVCPRMYGIDKSKTKVGLLGIEIELSKDSVDHQYQKTTSCMTWIVLNA